MQIDFGGVSFPFFFEEDCGSRLKSVVDELGVDTVIVVGDRTALAHHGDRILDTLRRSFRVTTVPIDSCEEEKTFESLQRICELALRGGATRRSLIVAFGGGVVGNVAGLAAGLLFRGIRLLHVPTTLMAAFDSVLSLKQAVNCNGTKNVVGLYHPPQAVLVDLQTFSTLSERDFRSGICETIKNVVAIAPDTEQSVRKIVTPTSRRGHQSLATLMELSIDAKIQRVMANDPRERTKAVVLEYGHTVGHAVEIMEMALWGNKGLRHGEAVAVGMNVAAHVSEDLGYSDGSIIDITLGLLEAAEVVNKVPSELPTEDIISTVLRDNKKGIVPCVDGETLMVVLEAPGVPKLTGDVPLVPVPLAAISRAIDLSR